MNNVSKYVETGETSNYSMFVSPLHQRDITDSNIKNIMKSIKEHGVIEAISVRPSVEEAGKYEVYNGQHKLAACKRLGAPVIYNVFRDTSNMAIIALSGKNRNWNMSDYLKYGVTDNISDYILLNDIYKRESIPLTALIMMYGGSFANAAFKELKWAALTVDRGNKILEHLKDFEKMFNVEHSRHARFIWGFAKVVDSVLYEHERMLTQLSKCSQLLTKQANPKDYAQNIEMVYNYGLQDKNKVRFTQK